VIDRLERFGYALFLKDGRVRPTFRVIVYIVGVFVISGLLYGIVLAATGRQYPTHITFTEEFEVEGAALIAVVGVAILLRRYLDRRSVASLGLALRRRWWLHFLIGGLIGAFMQLCVFVMETGLGYSHVTAVGTPSADLAGLAVAVPFFLIVAIVEETGFRGYLLQNFWEDFGLVPAALLTAALFAASHLGNPHSKEERWLTLAGLAAFGVWAVVSVVWTRSLWVAIGVHFAWNLFEGPVLGFPVSGLSFAHEAISQTVSGPAWFTGGTFGPESGASSLIALALGLAALFGLRRAGAFKGAPDDREAYARPAK
jgi:uncharacterized protein